MERLLMILGQAVQWGALVVLGTAFWVLLAWWIFGG